MTLRQGMAAGVAAAMMIGTTWAADLESDEQVASYGIGYGFASNLLQQTQGLDLDIEALLAGVQAGFEGSDSELDNERINAAIEALQQKQMAAQAENQQRSRAEGIAFLEENAERDGVMVTESGLQYEVLSSTDDGASPTAEDTVRVHYHGTLVNGNVFDSSVDRGEPIEFPLSGVIPGWTEGVQLMSEGDKYKFYIPSNLAYGENSPSPAIPAGSVLVFEVELLEVISN